MKDDNIFYYYHLAKQDFMPIEGEYVNLEGFDEIKLFAHHPVKYSFVKKGVSLSEAKTGTHIVTAATLEEAKEKAYLLFEKQGLEGIKKAIRKNVGNQGLSPRYKNEKP